MKIEAKDKTISRDYSARILENIWVEKPPGNETKLAGKHLLLGPEKLTPILETIQNAQKSIAICSRVLSAPQVLKALAQAHQKGVRIYILLNEDGGGKGKWFTELASLGLIRLTAKLPGTLLIADRKKGIFLNAPLQEGFEHLQNLAIRLDNYQVDSLFYFFCHQFWENSQAEVRSGRQLKNPKETMDSPFGAIPLVDPVLRESKVKDWLHQSLQPGKAMLAYWPNIRNENPVFSLPEAGVLKGEIITSIQGNNQNALQEAVKNGISIYATGSDQLPMASFVAIAGEGAWILPERTLQDKDYPYLIKLNSHQEVELNAYFQKIKQESEYRFYGQQSYAQVKGNFYPLEGLDLAKPQAVLPSVVDQQVYTLSLDELAQTPWEQKLAEKELLALKVDYQIRLLPETAPGGAQLDKLYSEWNKIQARFDDKLEEMEAFLGLLESQRTSVADRAKRWLSGFLTGKSQRLSDHDEKIKVWKALALSDSGIEAARSHFTAINSLLEEIEVDSQEISMKIEEGNAKAKFEENKDRLKEELAELQEAQTQYESELENWEDTSLVLLEQCEQEVREQKAEFVNRYFGPVSENDTSKQGKKLVQSIGIAFSVEEWDKGRSEVQRLRGEYRKKGKGGRTESDLLKEMVKEIESIDGVLNAHQRDRNRKKEESEKKVKTSLVQIAQLEAKVAEDFVFTRNPQDKKQSKLKSMKGKSTHSKAPAKNSIEPLRPQDIPQEELPLVGELLSNGKDRYLAIATWDEYEEGKIEATRFKAKLVCKQENLQ